MKLKLLILSFILIASATLRFFNYEGRTNYGFDQSRDIAVLNTYTSTKRLPLLGPIVRGDIGGFYLGPLYHYLLIPLYALSSHNPLVLVYLSIALDVAVAVALALIIAPSSGIIWAFSSLLINSSLTPWNVSLIHPWIVLCLYLINRLINKPTITTVTLFCLLLGTSTSIHLTLWPLALVYLLFALPIIWRISVRLWSYSLYLIALILPQVPLILSDLNRGWVNIRAFKDFLLVHSSQGTSRFGEFALTFINKLGFTVSRLFLGEPYLGLGLIFTLLILLYGVRRYKLNTYIKYSVITILVIFLSLFIYRDLDFAEYYLNAALVSMVVIFSYFLRSLNRPILMGIALVIMIASNYRSLNFATGPYTMLSKKLLVEKVVPVVKEGVDLHLLFNEHQQFGFAHYLQSSGIKLDKSSRLKLFIAPVELSHIPAPEDAPSIIYQTTEGVFQLVVFSN